MTAALPIDSNLSIYPRAFRCSAAIATVWESRLISQATTVHISLGVYFAATAKAGHLIASAMLGVPRTFFSAAIVFSFVILCSRIFTQPIRNCPSNIYCFGALLDRIQRAGLYPDSKQFVDMPTSKPESEVLEAFASLPSNASSTELQAFVMSNFHRAGYELKVVIPQDWDSSPAFLERVKDAQVKDFSRQIHDKWKGLTRRFDRKRLCQGCTASSIELPYPFVVPGGRFREFYYWDSYWIMEGLFVSGMCNTAKGMIENLLEMIRVCGFIPNGSRIYYMNRSQPPLLPAMIDRFLGACKLEDERSFLEAAVPLLDIEHAFWQEHRTIHLEAPPGSSRKAPFQLNIYRAESQAPRPESYREDLQQAAGFDENTARNFYRDIATAAESGWDFSSRWFKKTAELSSIRTTEIVPVDLNSIMYNNELIIARLLGKIGKYALQEKYQHGALDRLDAIHTFMWSPEDRAWHDYNITAQSHLNRPFYISDLAPLWFKAYRDADFPADTIAEILQKQSKILTEYAGGVPVSEVISGQQWDFPNVWAPIQYFMMSLYTRLADEHNQPEYRIRAIDLAQRWINTTYCGFKRQGHIFEKYHAQLVGQPGGGGEYIVQDGFGWSNGVLLWAVNQFPSELHVPSECPSYPLARARALPIFIKDPLDLDIDDALIQAQTLYMLKYVFLWVGGLSGVALVYMAGKWVRSYGRCFRNSLSAGRVKF